MDHTNISQLDKGNVSLMRRRETMKEETLFANSQFISIDNHWESRTWFDAEYICLRILNFLVCMLRANCYKYKLRNIRRIYSCAFHCELRCSWTLQWVIVSMGRYDVHNKKRNSLDYCKEWWKIEGPRLLNLILSSKLPFFVKKFRHNNGKQRCNIII